MQHQEPEKSQARVNRNFTYKRLLYPWSTNIAISKPAPNHLMVLHLLWDKAKISSMSHQGFPSLAPWVLWHRLLLLPSHPILTTLILLWLSSLWAWAHQLSLLRSFLPILLQASPADSVIPSLTGNHQPHFPRFSKQRWALPNLWPHRTLHIRYFFIARTTLYFNYLFTQSLPQDWVARKIGRVEEVKWEVSVNISDGLGTTHPEAFQF